MEQNLNSIGKRIETLRNKKGWKRAQLAEKIHVTDKAIWKWENDRGEPSIECLIQLANVFDVSLDYLVMGCEAQSSVDTPPVVTAAEYKIGKINLSIGQRIYARTHAEFLNSMFGTELKAYYRCIYCLNETDYVWMINLSLKTSKFGWRNYISKTDDPNIGFVIKEEYVGNPLTKIPSHNYDAKNQYRYIFDIKEDFNGRYYEYKGLFRCSNDSAVNLRVWKPVV